MKKIDRVIERLEMKLLWAAGRDDDLQDAITMLKALRDQSVEALRLLRAEDDRQTKLHEILETIREQIRLGVEPEHRPDGLFTNIQNAVYAMRGRTLLMNDAAITAAFSE